MVFNRILFPVIGLTLVILLVVACGTPSTPRIIEHPRPCPAGHLFLARGSPVIESECERVSYRYRGLDPNHPTAVCTKDYESGDECLRHSGGLIHICERVIVYLDGTFQLVSTREELKDLFAPIESPDEALSYALLTTGYSTKYDPGDYRLEVPGPCDPGPRGYRYYVDTLEDTHVVEVANGYEINLFDSQEFGCEPHPVWSVTVRVYYDGAIGEPRKVKLFEEDLSRPGVTVCCID